MSDADIYAGQRWIDEIGGSLAKSQFGIIVVTRENVSAPWLLFEAGALSNAYAPNMVCPYLVGIGMSGISGPLAQFQAKTSDRTSTRSLVEAINRQAQTPVADERWGAVFEALWPKLEACIAAAPTTDSAPLAVRPVTEILDEVVERMTRAEFQLSALGNVLNESELLATVARANKARRIDVYVEGEFPNNKAGDHFCMPAYENALAEVSKALGVAMHDYGTAWMIEDASTPGRLYFPADGPSLAARSVAGQQVSLRALRPVR